MSRLERARRWWPWAVLGVVVLAFAVRLVVVGIPAVADRLPYSPYSRSIHYQDAALSVLDGGPAVIHPEHVGRVAARWRADTTFLPPDAATIPREQVDTSVPFYDERGYLLLTLGVARVTGRVAYLDLLFLQALVSTTIVGLLMLAADRARGALVGIGVGLALALNPLEIMLVAMPDLPVWAVWATLLAACAVLVPPGDRVGPDLIWRGLVGVFVGWAIVLRAPTAAVLVIALLALPWVRGRRGWGQAAVMVAGALFGILLPAIVPLDIPSVGRTAFWHTLLGGLSEFGDVDGLRWHDAAIYAYVESRHGVTLGDPGFSEASKSEYLALLTERPWLPAWVTLQRLGHFAMAYRPGKEGVIWIAAMWMVKAPFLLATGVWVRRTRGRDRRGAVAVVLVLLAPLLAHALIVPLLEVYVAPTLVGMMVLVGGAFGALIARRVRSNDATALSPVRGEHG